MKIKQSKILNDMMTELFNIDFLYVDDLLLEAYHYTIADKTTAEEGVQMGFELCVLAQKCGKDIYEVECYPGDFSAYFIGTLSEIKKIFNTHLKKAKEGEKDE